jgi:hypothetical protein
MSPGRCACRRPRGSRPTIVSAVNGWGSIGVPDTRVLLEHVGGAVAGLLRSSRIEPCARRFGCSIETRSLGSGWRAAPWRSISTPTPPGPADAGDAHAHQRGTLWSILRASARAFGAWSSFSSFWRRSVSRVARHCWTTFGSSPRRNMRCRSRSMICVPLPPRRGGRPSCSWSRPRPSRDATAKPACAARRPPAQPRDRGAGRST